MTTDKLRFGFGRNWSTFVDKHLNDATIAASVDHLRRLLKRDSLAGLRVLDIGCGSGVHSLAMMRLGASEVVAFDYDAQSVKAAARVRAWAGEPAGWRIEQGSVLDQTYLARLGHFDLVYSWGVLHHTGAMWEAVRNAAAAVAPGGELYIALYSSDTYIDPPPDEWLRVKKRYNEASFLRRRAMEIHHQVTQIIAPQLGAGKTVLQAVREYGSRGMNIWTDTRDWLGGWPMEFAGLHETCEFVRRASGLSLVNVANGEGCTEYVFADPAANAHWGRIVAGRALLHLPGPYVSAGGYGFVASLPELASSADDGRNHKRSTLMLYEDGRPLGLAHCIHDAIRNHGAGRFSHWGEQLVFAASNNTDPNANGLSYSYVIDY
jgi:16S rRNA G966 N2-methylase RsmD